MAAVEKHRTLDAADEPLPQGHHDPARHMQAQERDALSSASLQSTNLRLKRAELRKRQEELDRLMRPSGRDLSALLPTQSLSQGDARPAHSRCNPIAVLTEGRCDLDHRS